MVTFEEVKELALRESKNWAKDKGIKPGYRAKPFLEWHSNEETYVGVIIYKGRKRIGMVSTSVQTPAYLYDSAPDLPRNEEFPGDNQANLDYAYRWLRSNGDMGYSLWERLSENLREAKDSPREAFRES